MLITSQMRLHAVFKSLGVALKGAFTTIKNIDIINNASGIQTVQLHGEAKIKAEEKDITSLVIMCFLPCCKLAYHLFTY